MKITKHILHFSASVLLAIALLLVASESKAQSDNTIHLKPKQHVYYDTIKEVKQRIDFSPDTIPVWFVEIQMPKDTTSNQPFITLKKGFVIWQVYRKNEGLTLGGTISSTGSLTWSNYPDFYKEEYQFSPSMLGTFLYSDRKTIVKNHVVYCIKR